MVLAFSVSSTLGYASVKGQRKQISCIWRWYVTGAPQHSPK